MELTFGEMIAKNLVVMEEIMATITVMTETKLVVMDVPQHVHLRQDGSAKEEQQLVQTPVMKCVGMANIMESE